MSVILGLNCNHADSSACIIKDGNLLYAIEEERLNRIKHWAGLPNKSILEALKFTNLDIKEITDISINTNPLSNINNKILYFLKNYILGKKKYEIFNRLKKKQNLLRDLNNSIKPLSFKKNVKVHYIDHHISHIASAFFPSNFSDAVGLSIDGFGDFSSICIARCDQKEIKILKKYLFPHSLGIFFETFTQLIGFKNYGDEYKMMGLSSYGKPEYSDLIMNEVFDHKNMLELNLKYFNHAKNNFSYNFQGTPNQNQLYNDELENLFKVKNLQLDKITQKQKDIAASAQDVFEKKLLKICHEIKDMKISDNLVFAGGCALNSLANKKIFEKNIFKNIFIPYAPSDGGGSIGSALYVQNQKNTKTKFVNLQNPYLGNDYTNSEIEYTISNIKLLENFNFRFYKSKNDLFYEVAKLIYQNKIVGLFNGRMEFGARALGNRSILANPCNPDIKNIINIKIKRRESFRPFAPAIIEEKKEEWFNNSRKNMYMSSVEKINDDKIKIIPGVTHIDGTGRVQTVSKLFNEDFYKLIWNFYKLSNVPILLNTSFNENEPIVMSPKNAIDCFLRTDMDILVLNNYIIKR